MPKHKHRGLFFGVNLEPSQSLIFSEVPSRIPGLISNKMTSFFGSMEIGYALGSYFGLSTGIGYNSYKTQLMLNSYSRNTMMIDTEQEDYELQVTGSKISEEQYIGSISLPFNLNLHVPLGNIIGIFVQLGTSLNVPVVKNYSSHGTFTYKGYYPKYDVLLEKLPDYKFEDNLYSFVKEELKLSSYFFNYVASGGLSFNTKDNTQLALAFTYNTSLSSISAYQTNGNFLVSAEPNKINSFMGESNLVSAQSIGITFTIRHFFGSSEY
jgi:hypothetical protein